MKPVGLTDPRTGRFPYAVVQLRQDTLAGDHFSLVGFQTQLKWGEQARVLRMIPGLEHAEFVRFGMVHRNTYINGPTVLRETWQTRTRDDLFFAGQVSGVEGYVESAASGLIAGRNAAALVQEPPAGRAAADDGHRRARPTTCRTRTRRTTSRPTSRTASWRRSSNPPRDKLRKKMLIAERALADLEAWQQTAARLARRQSTPARHRLMKDLPQGVSRLSPLQPQRLALTPFAPTTPTSRST